MTVSKKERKIVFLFWLPHYIKVGNADPGSVLGLMKDLVVSRTRTTDADAGTAKTLANNFEYGLLVGSLVILDILLVVAFTERVVGQLDSSVQSK